VFHGNPQVYGYIAESLRGFPDNRSFLELLERSGLVPQSRVPLFLGFLHLTVVRRGG
jgi:hypothetical protein